MVDGTPPKAPSKTLVRNKLPSKIPPKSTPAAAGKTNTTKVPNTATKVPIPTSKRISKGPMSASKLLPAAPQQSGRKKSLSERIPVKMERKSYPNSSSTVKKDGEQFLDPSSETKPVDTSILTHTLSIPSSSSDKSVHFATYDEALSSVETSREMPGLHEVDTTENREELYEESNILFEGAEKNKESASSIMQQTTYSSAPLLTENVEIEKHKGDGIRKNDIRDYESKEMNVNDQLLKAEKCITQLTEEVTKLQGILSKVEKPSLVQHTLKLENELKEVQEKLVEERTSTRYHKEAHLVALGEVGKLREKKDQFGTHTSLTKRNAELEARIDEMAREKIEQELDIARLKEEAYALKVQFGNSSCGSEFVTVHQNTVQLRDRVSQLTESKPLGFVPSPLSESWSLDIVRELQKSREAPPLNSTSHTSTVYASVWQKTKQGEVSPSSNVFPSSTVPEMQSDKVAVSEELRGLGVMGKEWRELFAPDGRTIYYNIITNKSTFELPAEIMSLKK
ncbi:hypothetical protein LSM04_003795 [Trypanosoma melophagium]|uniref:uncharacterized protein n=1 Tax=Trypanosoma melophagium TaxID=715481 RepID=UPI00351A1FDB|nr:hypothetical protein LSM04_003795 [Trypanosoma melophagium]